MMVGDEGSFEVIAVALEPRSRLERFARYYLEQGATRVSIYFDGDEDYGFEDARIAFRKCDGGFWKELGGSRPFSVEARQRAIYRWAYSRCEAPWCLIVDLDEYVMGPRKLRAFLGDCPGQVRSVRFASAEAVYAPGQGIDEEFGASCFRLPIGKYLSPLVCRVLYRGLAPLYSRGLLGHSRGKQASRTGVERISIGIHDATVDGRWLGSTRESHAAGFFLAHYDAISFRHWAEKCDRRLARGDTLEMGSKREKQLQLYSACAGEDDRRVLFRRLYALSAWQLFVLRLLGLGGAYASLKQQSSNGQSEREKLNTYHPSSA